MSQKRIAVTKRILQCDCCDSKTERFYVSYHDPDKPGRSEYFGEKMGVRPTATRHGSVCSAEHAMVLIDKFLREEGELNAPSDDTSGREESKERDESTTERGR